MRRPWALAWCIILFIIAIAPAPAIAASATFKLPSHIIIETQEHPGPNDPERCIGQVFVEFPHIPKAVSYAVTLDDLVFFFDGTRTGPPFPADDLWLGPAHFVAPAGFHRFALDSQSRGDGCAQTILALEGRWRITASKVSMNEKFTERWRKKVNKCFIKTYRRTNDPVVVGRRGGTFMFKLEGANRGTFITLPGHPPTRLMNEMWYRDVGDGPVIIETGRNSSMVKIAGLEPSPSWDPFDSSYRAGEPVVIGPGSKVRLEPGKPLKLLETTEGVDLHSIPKTVRVLYIAPNVRTNGCVVAARG